MGASALFRFVLSYFFCIVGSIISIPALFIFWTVSLEVCPVALLKRCISAMHFFKFQCKSQEKSEEDFTKEL